MPGDQHQIARRNCADREMQPRPQILLWVRPRRGPPARNLPHCQALAQKVRRRLRDGQLDPGKYEGVPEMPGDDREEWGMQSHDVQEVQVRGQSTNFFIYRSILRDCGVL